MVFNIDKLFYKARVGLSSEEEVKYSQVANAAENAAEAAKSCEKIDKLSQKAKKGSCTALICQCFQQDLQDKLS